MEDSKQFGQRGKLQIYGSVAMMVGFGLDQQMREPPEVHCYYAPGFLITLHRPIAAVAYSHVFVGGAHHVFGSLRT